MLNSNQFMQNCVSGSQAIARKIPVEYAIGIRVICIRARPFIGIKGSASLNLPQQKSCRKVLSCASKKLLNAEVL